MSEGEDFIRSEAAVRGIDPDVACTVAMSEGGVDFPGNVGEFNTGSSFWQYQLHYGGPEYPQFGVPGESVMGMGGAFTDLTGWAPGDPDAARDACRYALNRAKESGWDAWYGAAAAGITGFDGIDQSVAWEPNSQVWDYEQMSAGAELPHYDPEYPTIAQEESFDCSETSALWSLRAWGRETSDDWLENQMIAEGVMTAEYGLMDSTGGGLADFLNRHYAELGYLSSHDGSVSFDDIALEAVDQLYPLMIGGRAWGHWSGCRGYTAATDQLELANPANGYKGVYQTMSRSQFNALGAFSMVRLRHPEAEAAGTEEEVAYAKPGEVGTGILEMMAEDGTAPALPSTFLPIGTEPSVAEQCWGLNGTQYLFHIPTGRRWRYPAA
jgi:hypothetical protein